MSKQRVSPFYRDLHLLLKLSSCFHERNVYRFPENGTLPLSKQRVSPFYHDLDLGLVGWELFACRATSPSVCRATFEPTSNIQSCFKEIFGGGRGDADTFSCMSSPVSILTTFGIQ